jgi:quinol monooxygenase YgiN
MLIVAAEAIVDEDAIGELREVLRTMEAETRKEPGCLTYAFSVDVSDPTTLRIFERWESTAALAAHFQTPHMAAFGRAIGNVQPKSMDIKVYQVERELPLPR